MTKVDRVGLEGQMNFCGESIIAGPSGETISLGGSELELLLCEIELSQASALRASKPYTQLRRTELYE